MEVTINLRDVVKESFLVEVLVRKIKEIFKRLGTSLFNAPTKDVPSNEVMK